MFEYYDRQGNLISEDEYIKICENGRRVAFDDLGDYYVSTVFLGTNHNYFGGPPLIFETMVFRRSDHQGVYQDRYSSEDAAIKGHKETVEMVKRGEIEEDDE